MELCGLAFAGANLPPDTDGFIAGVMTAEEISHLDLRGCELVVLSACDTNVGERRAGQGIASLQQAVYAAGARASMTSLWKVSDEATRELMVDFYRRMWVEMKPNACSGLRSARRLSTPGPVRVTGPVWDPYLTALAQPAGGTLRPVSAAMRTCESLSTASEDRRVARERLCVLGMHARVIA